jgi:ABC-type molybdenum transport system ATPase subunit/photorepair protein PhrA
MNNITERLQVIKNGINKLKAYREFLTTRVKSAEKSVDDCKYNADLQQKSSEIFKSWLEDSMKENIESISELATTGLHHIIYDQSLSFKIIQEMKYNRVFIRFAINQNNIEGDPLLSFGGGPAVIISLILRLAVMTRMKMGNLLLLDESMVALANHYVPHAAIFIRTLAEQTGINILMVTHNNQFLQEAHVAYEGYNDGNMKLKKIKSI